MSVPKKETSLMASLGVGKPKQLYPINSVGVHFMYGLVPSSYAAKPLALATVRDGMHRFYPPRRSDHWKFYQEFMRICQQEIPRESLPSECEPKPMVGMVGCWVVFGPTVWSNAKFHDILIDLLHSSLNGEYPGLQSLIQIKAVVHVNKTRDLLEFCYFGPPDDVSENTSPGQTDPPPNLGHVDCNIILVVEEKTKNDDINPHGKKRKQASIVGFFKKKKN